MNEADYSELSKIHISEEGIRKVLKELNPNKACGPDGISPRMLKELADEVAPILTLLFRTSMDTGTVPEDWRSANITPVFKKGEHYDPVNYRPVSLTGIPCKIMEHVIVSSLMDHLDVGEKVGRRFGWVGWPVARPWSVVHMGSNKVFFMLWHSCVTTTRWHGDLADDVYFIHFPLPVAYSIHVVHKHIDLHWLQSSHWSVYWQLTHCVVQQSTSWLTTPSQLHQDVHRKVNKSITTSIDTQCTTSQAPLPFLTHIFTVTHSFTQGIFLAAWPIRFLINPYSQSQGTQSQRSLTIFSINLQFKPHLHQLPRAVQVSARCYNGEHI